MSAVGKALQAFGDVAIDFMIAVQKRAPQSGPNLQSPIFHLLWNLSAWLGKIKKGRYATGFKNAVDFVKCYSEVGCVSKRIAAGDDVDGFGSNRKRSHILVGETDIGMRIAVTRDCQHRL